MPSLSCSIWPAHDGDFTLQNSLYYLFEHYTSQLPYIDILSTRQIEAPNVSGTSGTNTSGMDANAVQAHEADPDAPPMSSKYVVDAGMSDTGMSYADSDGGCNYLELTPSEITERVIDRVLPVQPGFKWSEHPTISEGEDGSPGIRLGADKDGYERKVIQERGVGDRLEVRNILCWRRKIQYLKAWRASDTQALTNTATALGLGVIGTDHDALVARLVKRMMDWEGIRHLAEDVMYALARSPLLTVENAASRLNKFDSFGAFRVHESMKDRRAEGGSVAGSVYEWQIDVHHEGHEKNHYRGNSKDLLSTRRYAPHHRVRTTRNDTKLNTAAQGWAGLFNQGTIGEETLSWLTTQVMMREEMHNKSSEHARQIIESFVNEVIKHGEIKKEQ